MDTFTTLHFTLDTSTSTTRNNKFTSARSPSPFAKETSSVGIKRFETDGNDEKIQKYDDDLLCSTVWHAGTHWAELHTTDTTQRSIV